MEKAKIKNMRQSLKTEDPKNGETAPVTAPIGKGKQAEVKEPEKQLIGFIVPPQLMDAIVKYLAPKPWAEINSIMVQIETTVKPLFKPKENETSNKETPAE